MYKAILLILFLCLTSISFAADSDEVSQDAIDECQIITDYELSISTYFNNPVEGCLIKLLPSVLIVEGNYHRVILDNGTAITWESPDRNSPECQNDPCGNFYTFVNYILEDDLVVIKTLYEEGKDYEVISLDTGESSRFSTLPEFSPNKQRFLTFYGEGGCPFYKSEIWNFQNGYAEKEFEYPNPQANCGFITWKTNSQVVVQSFDYVYNSTTGKHDKVLGSSVLIQLIDGQWQAREVQ